jgi:hypothetical protein
MVMALSDNSGPRRNGKNHRGGEKGPAKIRLEILPESHDPLLSFEKIGGASIAIQGNLCGRTFACQLEKSVCGDKAKMSGVRGQTYFDSQPSPSQMGMFILTLHSLLGGSTNHAKA